MAIPQNRRFYSDNTYMPGNCVANSCFSGRCKIAAGSNSINIKNDLVTASSTISATIETTDGTLTSVTVTLATREFTITGNANATGNVQIYWKLT